MRAATFGTGSDHAVSESPPITAAPFTVMLRGISINTAGGPHAIFWLGDKDNNNHYWYLRKQASAATTIAATTNANTGDASGITTNTIEQNVPFTLALVVASATDRRVVLNGDFAGQGTSTTSRTPTGVDRLAFGRYMGSTPASSWMGPVMSAALWNVALNDAEITAWHRGARARLIRRQSLVALWPTFVAQGGLILDAVGSSHLTLTGGALSGSADPVRSFGRRLRFRQ